RSSGSARRRPVRTGPPTASSAATDPARVHGRPEHPLGPAVVVCGVRRPAGEAARAPVVPVRQGGRVRHTVRVPMRWSDMDAYQHINNVAFLGYFEMARVNLFFEHPTHDDRTGMRR